MYPLKMMIFRSHVCEHLGQELCISRRSGFDGCFDSQEGRHLGETKLAPVEAVNLDTGKAPGATGQWP